MSIPIPVFWSLLAESKLLTAEQCQQLAADFSQVKGASDQSNARTLAEWLVARNVLSRYQTTILLAGRPGPFHYGDYKVYDRIEKGRLAGYFRAVHGPTGHPVLLQFLTGTVIQDPEAWAAAVQNTLAAAMVQSPHLPRIFEPVDLGSFKFVVTEDLRGATLDERVAMGRFPPQEACRLVRQAALGLAQLHQSGRAHGDVRPANLLLETSVQGHPGDVKVLYDAHLVPGPIHFAPSDPAGIAKLTAQADYFAPELMQAGRAPDPLSDVYALGCTLYCLLTGSPPFVGGNVLQKMTRHATEAIRPLESFGVPQPLAQIVTYMLAKNPQVRYQSPAIVAEQLAPFVDPALLYFNPAQPLPTQASYEQWVQQKQAQLAAAMQPAPQPEPEAKPETFSLRIQEAGEAVVSAKSKDGPALPGVTIAGANPRSTTSTYISPEEYAALREKEQTKKVIMALAGVGAVAISLLILVYAMNQKPASPDRQPTVAKVEEAPDEPQVVSIDELRRMAEQSSAVQGDRIATTPVNHPSGTAPSPAAGAGGATSPPAAKVEIAQETGPTQEVVPDDGKLLWASPTAGKPVEFRLVPPEGQLFMVVRPADMLASPEGAKVLEALGPQFATGRAAWEKAAGVELNEIDQIIIALHNNDAKFPRVSYAIRTKNLIPSNDLLQRWGNPGAMKEETATFYQGQPYCYYLADSPQGTSSFLMGELQDVREVARVSGAPPVMARDMERLKRSLDGDRHFNLLFNPDFFDNDDGEPLFRGVYQKVRQPLDWFLGDDLEAGLLSMHFGPAFYLEMRMLGQIGRDRYSLASDFRDRLDMVPRSIEDFLVLIDPPMYWKKLAFRYSGMTRDLHSAMRIGVEGDQAIINAYLPGPAAHNLVLGGELLVSSTPGVVAGPAVATPTVAIGPKTIDELLKMKSSMQFDAQSLEFAMRDVEADAQDLAKGSPFAKGGPKQLTIRMIGGDLEKDGITRNMTIRDFSQKDKTIAEILTALVMRANPVTTVKTPDEPDQKLIWVIGPDPDSGKEVILITTRAAAAAKKYTLPPEFREKGK